ncbi:hypothetical protein OA262_03450, partial [Gammaproteobacteria bacterium]|nr:hypothetical protein [Gammaproteobacteria bacterium]
DIDELIKTPKMFQFYFHKDRGLNDSMISMAQEANFEIDGIELPPATVKEIEEAGKILSENGWDVEEVHAPELDKVFDMWGVILAEGGMDLAPKELFKPETAAYLDRWSETFSHINLSMDEKFIERFRLRKVWSNFVSKVL